MRIESSQQIQPRIMMYSQDGLGLGHMRRTSSIANQIAQVRSDAAILTMADSRLGQFFETSSNHDYLKLPSIRKLGPGQWSPVSLSSPFADVLALRAETIRALNEELAPLILTGPPAVTGFAGGRPKVEEIMAYFPALIPKHLIETRVEVIDA